jgi:hypothetical protein
MADSMLEQKILEIIAPISGELMAKSTIKVHCDKTGTRIEDLSAKDLPALAQRIIALLQIFVGIDKAKEVAEKIERLTA